MKLGKRSAGVLLHVTSLPGPHGIGDLGPQAHEFARTLAECGQSWWQMLPISPPGAGDSPYSSLSAFAGNPLLLSLDRLADEGLLSKEDLSGPGFPKGRVEFSAVERFKKPLLRKAFEVFAAGRYPALKKDLVSFQKRRANWLPDYALFAALKEAHGGASWTAWEDGLRRREPKALEAARRSLKKEILFQIFLQHQFSRQWRALHDHCRRLGVGLIGDLPIFVSHDSADVWAHQELFWLDRGGTPLKVAGVPPDYFSSTGQLWGNPLYRWDAMRRSGYAWWVARFAAAFEHFDAVRLDHFIGFHNYWEIPGGAATAEGGRWILAPGAELFETVGKKLGELPLIAEDLGVVTPEVKALRDRFGFPGLRVLQMAFGTDAEADTYKPHNYSANCVVYTGTHDNDTTAGWFESAASAASTRSPEDVARERAAILSYLGGGAEIHWDMIRLAYMSVAATAVIPAQDLLGLGSEARMNLPGTASGNWGWRLEEAALTPEIRRRWAALTKTYGRASAISAAAERPRSHRRVLRPRVSRPA